MIIYKNDRRGFLEDAFEDQIEDVILASYQKRTGKSVAPSEIRSWASSLMHMAKVLRDTSMPDDLGVAIEYGIPQTAKRVDFLVSGKQQGRSSLVLIELKQWDSATATNKDAVVSTRFARGEKETNHPSYQAWSYVELMRSFNEAVYDGGIQVEPCAYLHNYPLPGSPLTDTFYQSHVAAAPVFLRGKEEMQRLREFIRMHLPHGDGGEALVELENGRIRPSRGLADSLASMMEGNQEFVLIDDQKVAFETIMLAARSAESGPKQVVIVEGGPGTGKTVVAINLLVQAIKERLLAKYVTKNSAPRVVYESKLTGTMKKTVISNLFSGSGSFTETAEDAFDLLIVDEAHRLNEKSGMFSHLGENQIMELIQSSSCSVFFVDDAQKVHIKDIGSKDTIEGWAKQMGAEITTLLLQSQFRCNGSDGYLAWLDNVLEIRETANTSLDDSGFDFQILDSPDKLMERIREKNEEANKARVVAGYCWPWPSKRDPSQYDIVFPAFEFKAKWNLEKDGMQWIIAPDSVHEVGCIHTCQGLEVDYIGVIIGPDLRFEGGRIVGDPTERARSDMSLHGWKKFLRENPGEEKRIEDLIKNTYRTLMTRGMKGCYVYCVDEALAVRLRSSMLA